MRIPNIYEASRYVTEILEASSGEINFFPLIMAFVMMLVSSVIVVVNWFCFLINKRIFFLLCFDAVCETFSIKALLLVAFDETWRAFAVKMSLVS